MAMDDTSVRKAQKAFHCDNGTVASARLYCELKRFAVAILMDMRAPADNLDQFSHDAASNLISQYLRRPGYTIHSFRKRLRLECLAVLRGRDLEPNAGHKHRIRTKAVRASLSFNEAIDCPPTEYHEEIDPSIDLRALFVRYKYFAPAIKQLRLHVDKSWMLANAREIHRIFLESRGG